MTSQLMREKRKIHRNLSGIRHMNKLPGALFVIDVTRERNALHEARSLGIPTVCLIDTDGNPDLVDIPIPGNDDSMRSIDVILREICASITTGKALRPDSTETADDQAHSTADAPARRTRSSRTQYRSDAPPPLEDTSENASVSPSVSIPAIPLTAPSITPPVTAPVSETPSESVVSPAPAETATE